MKKSAAREQLLDVAGRLFYRNGFLAVGVEKIVSESGISKMTLYKYFPSKDHLIVAILDRYVQQYWEWFEDTIREIPDSKQQLIAIFEAVGKQSTCLKGLGCLHQSVAVEFPSSKHMVHQAAIAHKQSLIKQLESMTELAGLKSPRILARHLFVLMEGAFISDRLFGTDSPSFDIVKAARTLIESHHS